MSCCAHCHAVDRHFDDAHAQGDLDRYQESGPIDTTRLLIDAIRGAAGTGARLLDIGAGIGVLHHELVPDTVASAVHVEASSAYVNVAKAETNRQHHTGRVTFVEGDFVDLAATLEDAEVVVLDRVICCYPDYEGLVAASVEKARAVYAFSVPRDRWYIRLGVATENLLRKFRGNPFRTFVHPIRHIDAMLAARGFRRTSTARTFGWEVALYERATSP